MSPCVITPIAPTVRGYRLDEALPEPLHDVLIEVELIPGDDPEVYQGYVDAGGTWFLTGADALRVTPRRWFPAPVPADLRADPVALVAAYVAHQQAETETVPRTALAELFRISCTADERAILDRFDTEVEIQRDAALLAHARRCVESEYLPMPSHGQMAAFLDKGAA